MLHLLSVLVTNASSFSTDIHAQGFDGLVGLGPNEGSNIFKKMKSSVGDTMQAIPSELALTYEANLK